MYLIYLIYDIYSNCSDIHIIMTIDMTYVFIAIEQGPSWLKKIRFQGSRSSALPRSERRDSFLPALLPYLTSRYKDAWEERRVKFFGRFMLVGVAERRFVVTMYD